jgi:hypothetical protein
LDKRYLIIGFTIFIISLIYQLWNWFFYIYGDIWDNIVIITAFAMVIGIVIIFVGLIESSEKVED